MPDGTRDSLIRFKKTSENKTQTVNKNEMRTEMATERVAELVGKFEWSLQTNAHVTAHPTTRNKYLFNIFIQNRMHKNETTILQKKHH